MELPKLDELEEYKFVFEVKKWVWESDR